MKTHLAGLTLSLGCLGAAAAAAVTAGPVSPYNPNVPNCFALSLIVQSPGGSPHFTNTSFLYGDFRPTPSDATWDSADATSYINAYTLYQWFMSYGQPNPTYFGISGLWARLELGTVQAPGEGVDHAAFTFQLRKDYMPTLQSLNGPVTLPTDATWRTGVFNAGYGYRPTPADFDLHPYEDTSANDHFANTRNTCYANTYGQRCRVFFFPIHRANVNADDNLLIRLFSGNYPLYRPPVDTLPSDVSFVVTDPNSVGQGCKGTFHLKPFTRDPSAPILPFQPPPPPGPGRPTLPGLDVR